MTTSAPSTLGDVRIRPAEHADLLAVHRIERESFPQPWPYHTFEQFLHDSDFLVAVDDSVIGYVVADVTPTYAGPVGHIKNLAVHPEHRREGIASTLIGTILGSLQGEADTVKLEVRESNDTALQLYREHGFRYHRTIQGYYRDDEDAFVLIRKL